MPENGETFNEPSSAGDPTAYECPACAQVVHATPGPVARLLECSNCGAHIVIPNEEGETDLAEELGPSEEEKATRAAGELNSLRMRHIIVQRRTAIRSRTYNIVGACGCLMGAIKLVIMARADVRTIGWHWEQIADILIAAVALYGVIFFAKRAAHWNRESRAPIFDAGKCPKCGYDLRATKEVCPECGTPVPADHAVPDFSTLSDGSQYAKNLEKL